MVRTAQRAMVFCAALAAVGAALAAPAHAAPAVPTQVDVGTTESGGGYWKGSGSYSNGNGTYVRFCVRLMLARPGPNQQLSSRCEATPAGSQQTFSAPDVACFQLSFTDYVYTEAAAYDKNNKKTAKESNGTSVCF